MEVGRRRGVTGWVKGEEREEKEEVGRAGERREDVVVAGRRERLEDGEKLREVLLTTERAFKHLKAICRPVAVQNAGVGHTKQPPSKKKTVVN